MRDRRSLLGWVALLGLALIARLVAFAVIAEYRSPWPWEVEVMARSLVERGSLAYDFYQLTPLLPTAFLPPVYPLFVAAALRLGGEQYGTVLQLAQVLLSTASVALLVPLTFEITRSRGAAWLAGVIAAVYPAFLMAAVQVNTATLEVLGIEVLAWLLLRWSRRTAWPWLALAGLSLGLLALTRGTALLIWPAVAFWLLVVFPSRALHRRILWLAVFSLCLIVPLLPWAVRNSQVIGAPVLIATNGGLNFWIGHNPAADGEYQWPLDTDLALAQRAAKLSEPARDELYYSLGWEYLKTHPVEEVQLSLRKLWYFLWFRPGLGSSYPNAGAYQAPAQVVLMGSYAVVLTWAIVGVWLSRREWRRIFVVYGIGVAYAASSIMYFAATRFRAPVEPFLIAFAALGLAWAFSRVSVRLTRPKPLRSSTDLAAQAPVRHYR